VRMQGKEVFVDVLPGHRTLVLEPSVEPSCSILRSSGNVHRDSLQIDEELIHDVPKSLLGHLRSATSHMRAPWTERIPWYPTMPRPYSRRELAADALVHAVGVCLTCTATGYMCFRLSAMGSRSPPLLNAAMWLYLASLLGMFVCSTFYNVGMGHWGKRHFETLACIDHAGICLLIAGSYTPVMLVSCCMRTLGFVWALALFTMAAKLHGGRLNTFTLHIPCFLLMGWSAIVVWSSLVEAFSEYSLKLVCLAGVFYTVGLIPWGVNKLEGHTCLWHVFVTLGSSCIFFAFVHDLERMPERLRACAFQG